MNKENEKPIEAVSAQVMSGECCKRLDSVFVVCDLERSIMKFFWEKVEAEEYMRGREGTEAPLYMKMVTNKGELEYVHDY
jgi:hypothetical protein